MVVMKTTEEVLNALRNKYYDGASAYAFLEQVGNATGFKCNRWADVIVISLWESRGLEIIGFEIKVSRTDWLKELKNPAKADVIANYCDSWYLVVGDENIVQFGELPMGWGLMVPHTNNSLKIVKESEKKAERPIDKHFLCAVARRVSEQLTDQAKLNKEFSRGYDSGKKEGKEWALDEIKWLKKSRDELQEKINVFQKSSGVDIDDWRFKGNVKQIGEAVKSVLNGTYMKQVRDLERLHERAVSISENLKEEINKIKNEKTNEKPIFPNK